MDPMLTLMQVAALATAGMCFALLGSVKLPLARKLEIDEGKVGGLISVFGFTLIPMVVAAGFLVDILGQQAVLGGGFVLVILSLVVLAHSRRYAAALLAVLVLGTGWSALVNVLNVTSPPAFVPPEDLPQRMAYAMNMGDFIFGMGTFVTPSVFWLTFMGSRLVTALTLRVGADTTLVIVMACCSIAITLGIVFCRGATLMCILIVVAGAVVGPIFPTLIAILLGHVEPSLHGRAVGIFFCIGGIGWTAIPIFIGMYAKRTTVQRGFLIASGSAVLLSILSVVLAVYLK